jgi:hypothetical protein
MSVSSAVNKAIDIPESQVVTAEYSNYLFVALK